jgi:hypothetical protein
MTVEWLRANPKLLFPSRFGNVAQLHHRWNLFKWKSQRALMERHNLDFIILGRRNIDGNWCGKNGVSFSEKMHKVRKKPGERSFTTYNVIYDWSHEMVLAAIHYYKLPLPPVYKTYDGYAKGAHPWPLTTEDDLRTRDPQLYEKWKPLIDELLYESRNASP